MVQNLTGVQITDMDDLNATTKAIYIRDYEMDLKPKKTSKQLKKKPPLSEDITDVLNLWGGETKSLVSLTGYPGRRRWLILTHIL